MARKKLETLTEKTDTLAKEPVRSPLFFSTPTPARSGIESVLAERGSNYGDFTEHARITQNIKDAMKDSTKWSKLSPAMKESLEMQAHKIGRILNGNPEFKDSWVDLEGYAHLISQELQEP